MKRLFTCFILLCTLVIPTRAIAAEPFDHLLPIDSEIKLLPWEKANELLPRKSIFTMIDIESGTSFQVQRRAGSKHADIQPLTSKDTKVLKAIYQEWSWKRRAVIVLYEGKMIAASMNGMPHGAGALDNGFNGHFCLHFLNSTTHRTPTPDPAHHLMILKAGGQLDRYLMKRTPEQLVDVLMLAINNTDASLLRRIVSTPLSENELIDLSRLSFTKWKVIKTDQAEQQVKTRVEIYIKDAGVITTTIDFAARQDPITNKWQLEIPKLLEISKD
ncbi:hypothetical protein [Pseudalkalibacillus sp. NRS-1564]|uniref:hypothetical protein n=1 Tax=Pseudalkalibacillus sp. NRS-1564 TaxID=3233900 RepID=UPI003D2BF5E7